MPTSAGYKAILANAALARDYAASLTIYGTPNTTLGDANILAGSMKYSESTAGGNELSIGTTVMSELNLTLLNLAGELDDVAIMNSQLRGQVGLMVGAAREWVDLGYFIVVHAPRGHKTIPVKAYDRMVLTERPFYLAGVTFPCTISEALSDICLACGITTTGITGTNSTITLTGIPESTRMTCRDAIGYLAMICGKVARFSRAGVLEFVWYGTTPVATITPALRDSPFHYDPVQINLTGVEYVAIDVNNAQTTYRAGTNTYCLSLAENPFLLGQDIQDILDGIWADIGASSYYIFDYDMQGDPSYLAGDCISLVLPDATTINTHIMTHNYAYRGHSRLSAVGRAATLVKYKPAAEKQLSAIAQAEQIATQKLTTYQLAMLQLNAFSAQAVGLYSSSDILPDGSVIYYQHDAPLYADSTYIWKQTATTFTYSADGGDTWNGIDVTGNILARVLTAIGVNANWLNAGTVSADRIGANSITTAKLRVGNFDNMLENPGYELGLDGWSGIAGAVPVLSNTSYSGNYSLSFAANGTLLRAYATQSIEVVPGEQYLISVWYKSASANGSCTAPGVYYYDKDGAYILSSGTTSPATSTWTKVERLVTIPDNVKYMRALIQVAATSTTGTWYFDDWLIRQAVAGTLVVNGKITSVDGSTWFDLETPEIVQTAVIDSKDVRVEMSPANPFKLTIDGDDCIYVTDDTGFSGPNILVTSKYDVNEDGRVDWEDIKMMFDYMFENDIAPGVAWPAGYPVARMDFNHSGTINSADIAEMAAYSLTSDRIINSGSALLMRYDGLKWSEDYGETLEAIPDIRMRTSASAGANSTYWLKVAQISFDAQYQTKAVKMEIVGSPSTAGAAYQATVLLEAIQQLAIENEPYGRVYISNPVSLGVDSVKAVITQTAGMSIIELYVQAIANYKVVYTRVIIEGGGGDADYTMGTWQAALPSGTQLTTYLAD